MVGGGGGRMRERKSAHQPFLFRGEKETFHYFSFPIGGGLLI